MTLRWLEEMRVYLERQILIIGVLGFFSGFPFLLVSGTLTYWLAKTNVDITLIGVFALIKLPYALKCFWAPLVDHLGLFPFTRFLGQRKGWLFFAQLSIVLGLTGIAFCDPSKAPLSFALWALLISFFSATQDIVIDAYRIETLEKNQQGAGAASYVLYYRLSLFASGAGAILFASAYGWKSCYLLMALIMSGGACFTLFLPRGHLKENLDTQVSTSNTLPKATRRAKILSWFKRAAVDPFVDFTTRDQWKLILPFIILYKVSDGVLGAVINPFYVQMGFTDAEIATAVKTFGIIATIVGGMLGGIWIKRSGILHVLWVSAMLQALSNGAYLLLLAMGHKVSILYLVIAIENICSGISSIVFVAYLSQLCSIGFAATQYALFLSLANTSQSFLASFSGIFIKKFGWAPFFLTTVVCGAPALVIARYFAYREKKPPPYNL